MRFLDVRVVSRISILLYEVVFEASSIFFTPKDPRNYREEKLGREKVDLRIRTMNYE